MTREMLTLWAWGVGQSTILAAAVFVLLGCRRRLAPQVRIPLLLLTLLLMNILPWCMFLPLRSSLLALLPTQLTRPAAYRPTDTRGELAQPDELTADGEPRVNSTVADSKPNPGPASAIVPPHSQSGASELSPAPTSTLDVVTNWLSDRLRPTRDRSPQLTEPRLPGVLSRGTKALAALAVVAVLVGLLRLAVAVLQIRTLIQTAKPSRSDRLQQQVAQLAARELERHGQQQRLELRISDRLGTPAVVGWWSWREGRPVNYVLLPTDWQDWSSSELTAALAHELAHVRRGDPWCNWLAQLALVGTYFHPLAHWFMGQLRLDQELAADDLAATWYGTRPAYLQQLATLALRRAVPRRELTALAFLPTRHTLIRRLDMLRDHSLSTLGGSRRAPWMLSLGVLSLAIAIGTLRPLGAQGLRQVDAVPGNQPASSGVPQTNSTPLPADEPVRAPQRKELPDLLSYVPGSVVSAVVDIEIDQVLELPPVKTWRESLPADQQRLTIGGHSFSLDHLQRVVIFLQTGNHEPEPTILVRLTGLAVTGSSALPNLGGPDPATLKMVDGRTAVLGHASADMLRIIANVDQADGLVAQLRRHEGYPVRAVWRSELFRPLASRPEFAVIAPLLDDAVMGSAGLKWDDQVQGIACQGLLDAPSRNKEVYETLQAVRTFAKNAIRGLRPEMVGGDDTSRVMILGLVKQLGLPLLDSIEITPRSEQVELQVTLPTQAVTLLTSLVTPALDAALREQRANNLRLIGLALLNYEAAHGHFPPSVLVENGVARSWRVEILPYLEQAALYNQYRKDLPWDAPENVAVMEMIPSVYQIPGTRGGANTLERAIGTPYRAIGGVHGVISAGAGGQGVKLSEITDGTSTTLMVVEANEPIQWTRPDEFTPTPEELLGAGVQNGTLPALYGDGHVEFHQPTDRARVEAALTRDGGEIVPLGGGF